jgi:hypothetical protein
VTYNNWQFAPAQFSPSLKEKLDKDFFLAYNTPFCYGCVCQEYTYF